MTLPEFTRCLTFKEAEILYESIQNIESAIVKKLENHSRFRRKLKLPIAVQSFTLYVKSSGGYWVADSDQIEITNFDELTNISEKQKNSNWKLHKKS